MLFGKPFSKKKLGQFIVPWSKRESILGRKKRWRHRSSISFSHFSTFCYGAVDRDRTSIEKRQCFLFSLFRLHLPGPDQSNKNTNDETMTRQKIRLLWCCPFSCMHLTSNPLLRKWPEKKRCKSCSRQSFSSEMNTFLIL